MALRRTRGAAERSQWSAALEGVLGAPAASVPAVYQETSAVQRRCVS